MELSPADREMVKSLRDDFGIFEDVESHRLDQHNGVIMMTCADGDQIADIFRYQAAQTAEQSGRSRVHTFALNGGALLISPSSPLVAGKPFIPEYLVEDQIRGAIQLKGIETLALYAHAPCGMAHSTHMSLTDVVSHLFEAKRFVKSRIPGLKVACFIHVDKGEGNKRTYFVSRQKWEEWVKKFSL